LGEVQVRHGCTLWESVENAINFGLGEVDVVAGFPCGLVKEVVAGVFGLWRSKSSRSQSREASHNIIKFVSGDGGPISSDGDD
jgi:hypothetical protein